MTMQYPTYAEAEVLENIVNIDVYANINDRGDVVSLKEYFDGDYVKRMSRGSMSLGGSRAGRAADEAEL